MNDSREGVVEMERVSSPGIFFVFFPAIWCVVGILILTILPQLVGAYNYLRGASSPIDQAILALLGSDLSRLVILASSIIGMMIGLYLSHLMTTKLDVVKKEREAQLSVRTFLALLWWWMFPLLLLSTTPSLETAVYGFPTSHFLRDISVFAMAAYSLAFSIPVLLKYTHLVLHTRSIDSRIILVEFRSGDGFWKRLQYLALRVIHEGPNP